ncbi:MAG: hypothetical protein QOE14_959 [Humisphaera sp.]|nr:hypothetical protein [Humisphaera sp.]
MAQPQKPAKHLHADDLPDPLGESHDIPMASADDLLSEIVDDDVERLMSGEYDPVHPAGKAVERLQQQIGSFLDEIRERERKTPPPPPTPKLPPTPQPHARARTVEKLLLREEEIAPSLDDLVGPTREELVGLHSGEFEPTAARGPAESRALLAPVDEAADEPIYLKPLDWMSAPIARMSGRTRIAVSMFAVMSFLAGCAALGYVLMLRHGS